VAVERLGLSHADRQLGRSNARSWPGMTHQQRKSDLDPVAFCEERRRLSEEFLATNRVLMDLHSQQTQAVIDNDHDFSRFDDLIHLAREKKDQAKYALIAHIEKHHC
jgi:hypothetical protein